MRHWQEWNNMNVILKILQKWNGRTILLLRGVLHLFKFSSIFKFPKPSHVIVWKHGTLVVGFGAGSVEEVATLSRFLLEHLFDDNPTINIHSHLYELSPVINLNFAGAFFILQVYMSWSTISTEVGTKFTKDDRYFYTTLYQLLLINQIFILQSGPAFAYNDIGAIMLDLL